jgi:hypothetical protein
MAKKFNRGDRVLVHCVHDEMVIINRSGVCQNGGDGVICILFDEHFDERLHSTDSRCWNIPASKLTLDLNNDMFKINL